MEDELEIKPKRKGEEFFSQGDGYFSGINSEESSDLVCPLQRRQQWMLEGHLFLVCILQNVFDESYLLFIFINNVRFCGFHSGASNCFL